MIIGHLHQTLRDQDRLFVGADPGHVTAGHDPGGLTPPLTKIVLLLRNVLGADLGHVTAAVRV